MSLVPSSFARVVGVLLLGAASIFAAAPDIDSLSPLSIKPGVPTEITLSGSDLAEATQLWASFPARTEHMGEARFRITAEKSFGVGMLRVLGSNGVSGLAFVLADDLRTVASIKTNHTRAAAQPVEFGGAVDGRCEELKFDWFRVRVNKGQRVAVETVAACLGSKLDSVLRVVNTAGRELARNDDAPAGSGDSYLSFAAPESADYFIEVRDVSYGGGSAFFYHLRVGDFPPMNRRFASAPGAHEVTEKEPNDAPAKATKVSLPVSIQGRFDKANDRDVFEFTAHKGEQLEFSAATRSLGSACDAVLQLDSAGGKRLARSNPSAADEGVLNYSFPSNGTYRLTVAEATGAFGSNMIYSVAAVPVAGFSFFVDTDRVNVAPGKSFDLKVTATRKDHKGAIHLELEGFPELKVLTNNVIAEGKSNVTMKVVAPSEITPGTWRTFSVVGRSSRNAEAPRVTASTAPALRRQLPQLLHAPAALDGEIAIGITRPKER